MENSIHCQAQYFDIYTYAGKMTISTERELFLSFYQVPLCAFRDHHARGEHFSFDQDSFILPVFWHFSKVHNLL